MHSSINIGSGIAGGILFDTNADDLINQSLYPIAAVCICISTERPEAMEAGDFILAGSSTRELIQATGMAIQMN